MSALQSILARPIIMLFSAIPKLLNEIKLYSNVALLELEKVNEEPAIQTHIKALRENLMASTSAEYIEEST